MSTIVITTIFVLSLLVSLIWGAKWTYVFIFLPVMVLLNQLPPVNLAHLTMAAQSAPMFGILLALPFQRDKLRLRWCWTDTVVVALMISGVITALSTEFVETAVNTLRNDVPRLAMPYFLARVVFQDWRMRRWALWVMVVLLAVVGACAGFEFMFTPNFYLQLLKKAGMSNSIHSMAYGRYGFYRVCGPVEHPIFFGNMCLVFLGMVAVLARTSGMRLRNIWVALALIASVACVVVSISYTPYMGLIAGSAAFATLMVVPLARRMLLPLTVGVVVVMASYTWYMAHSPIEEVVNDGTKQENNLQGSLNTRKKIIQESWGPASTAGPFGWGFKADFAEQDGFDLTSVDNSYMQFTMVRGWVYTVLWIGLGVSFAARAGRAFRLSQDRAQVFPVAVGAATILGLMISMYTVWAGALYAVVWIIMLGLCHALIDSIFAAAEARENSPVIGPLRPPMVRMPALAGGYGA